MSACLKYLCVRQTQQTQWVQMTVCVCCIVTVTFNAICVICLQCFCLHCFDALGGVAGRVSSCKKTLWWGAGVVICLEQCADLHMAQLMPLPLTVSFFSKIQIGFIFLVLAGPGSPGKRSIKWVCVCMYVFIMLNNSLSTRYFFPQLCYNWLQYVMASLHYVLHWIITYHYSP